MLILEPVDGGTEMTLKLRLSTTMGDVKLPVYSKDTIGVAKKKLQVCIVCINELFSIRFSLILVLSFFQSCNQILIITNILFLIN